MRLFLLLFCTSALAGTFPESYNSSIISLENKISLANIETSYKTAKGFLKEDLVQEILSDFQNKVDNQFVIDPYLRSSVNFWFHIYTQYNSSKVVIHDSKNLNLIYRVLDFQDIKRAKVNRFSKSKIQASLALVYTRSIKKALKKFSTGILTNLSQDEKNVLFAVKKAHDKIPKNKKLRKKFFFSLISNLRTQTGQRDQVYAGIIRSIPYWPFLQKQVKSFRLPKEILSISFLESSFNPKARSKVAAAGVWQFMPGVGNLLLPRSSKFLDYRLNPVVSSLGALHLLKENRQILRRWDLAISAYNSGTKFFVKMRRKFGKNKKKYNLEFILKTQKSSSIGFASKNFYAGFLALAHVLAYKDMIFPTAGIEKNIQKFRDPANLKVYVAKCTINPSRIYKSLEKSTPLIKDINTHILKSGRSYGRGTLVIHDGKLSKSKYYELSQKKLKKRFPRHYAKYIRKKRCGGR